MFKPCKKSIVFFESLVSSAEILISDSFFLPIPGTDRSLSGLLSVSYTHLMLNEKLDQYLEEDFYPFHMPGHKRNTEILRKDIPYARDITEIPGFDNLNNPKDPVSYTHLDVYKRQAASLAPISPSMISLPSFVST